MLSEKGLCGILKSAYKGGGYQVIPRTLKAEGTPESWRRNEITIIGGTWAVRCETAELPKQAAVQIVGDAGYLPMEAVGIKMGEPNQFLLESAANELYGLLERRSGEVYPMRKLPLIFKDRWQLYQTETGAVCAFDMDLLKMIDFKLAGDGLKCLLAAGGGLGLFAWESFTVYIAPGRFSGDDAEKLDHIAKLDWEHQMLYEDRVVNISLFDEDEDAPPEDREDE